MAKINDGVLRNWNNGETVDEASYERDFEILRVANNDNHDRIESNAGGIGALDTRTTLLETDNETNKANISTLQEDVSGHEARLDSAESGLADRYTKAETYNQTEVNTIAQLSNGVFVDGGSFLDVYVSGDGEIDGGAF